MKNNKIIITLISIATLLVVFTLFSLKSVFVANINKLKGDILYPTSNGVRLSCNDGTIAVNDTTTCTLTGYLEGGTNGITGKFVSSGFIEIQSINVESSMNLTRDGNSIHVQPSSGQPTPSSTFIVATVTIKGLAEGSSQLTFTGDMEEQVELTSTTWQSVYVNDATYDITVSNGGSVTPDPTPSSDNTLSSLKVGTQDVSLTDLTYTVDSDINVVSITATPNHGGATAVVEGAQGNLVSLTAGQNTIRIIVTAENGTPRTYTLTITRQQPQQQSSINTLSSLTVTNATLVPQFNSSKTDYRATVNNDVTSVSVNASRTDDKSSIIEGLGTHNLNVGINFIDVKVRAENGQVNTYSLTITRKEAEEINPDTTKSKDNKLKSLSVENGTLLPTFDNTKEQNYVAIVGDDVETVKIIAKENDTKATVSYSDNVTDGIFTFDRTADTKEINVIVTAENGSKKYYPVKIMRSSYYNQNKAEIDNNINNITDTCTIELRSSVYKVDNTKLEINNVNKNHSLDTIKSNLSTECGTITVNQDKVVVASNTQIKEYKINRVWLPQTGQKVIKYAAAILVLLLGIAGLIIYNKKSNK